MNFKGERRKDVQLEVKYPVCVDIRHKGSQEKVFRNFPEVQNKERQIGHIFRYGPTDTNIYLIICLTLIYLLAMKRKVMLVWLRGMKGS